MAILGRALPLVNNPLNIAEEYAMLDNISNGRIICGFVRGIGAEYHSTGINPVYSHERFREAHDLIVKAWTEPGPIDHQGGHYNLQVRQSLAASVSEAASADLDSIAGFRRDDFLGGRSCAQISVYRHLQSRSSLVLRYQTMYREQARFG